LERESLYSLLAESRSVRPLSFSVHRLVKNSGTQDEKPCAKKRLKSPEVDVLLQAWFMSCIFLMMQIKISGPNGYHHIDPPPPPHAHKDTPSFPDTTFIPATRTNFINLGWMGAPTTQKSCAGVNRNQDNSMRGGCADKDRGGVEGPEVRQSGGFRSPCGGEPPHTPSRQLSKAVGIDRITKMGSCASWQNSHHLRSPMLRANMSCIAGRVPGMSFCFSSAYNFSVRPPPGIFPRFPRERPGVKPPTPHTTSFENLAGLHQRYELESSEFVEHSMAVGDFGRESESSCFPQLMRKCRPGLMEYAMESIFKNHCYLQGQSTLWAACFPSRVWGGLGSEMANSMESWTSLQAE